MTAFPSFVTVVTAEHFGRPNQQAIPMDSITVDFPFRHSIPWGECPGTVASFESHDGSDRKTFPWTTVHCKDTNSSFKVQPLGIADDSPTITGYRVSFNPPTNSVGHNCLLENGAWAATRIARSMLQTHLLSTGLSIGLVRPIDLSDATLRECTATFLFPTKDIAAAKLLQRAIKERLEAVVPSDQQKNERLGYVGSNRHETIYYHHRDFDIRIYIKHDESTKHTSKVISAKDFAELRTIAARTVRIEVVCKMRWLKKHNLLSPRAWKESTWKTVSAANASIDDPYEKAFNLFKKVCRLDEVLRSRRPTDHDLRKISAEDKKLLRHHLEGRNIRELVEYRKDGESTNACDKRFWDLRQRILTRLSIDISIKWMDQQAKTHQKEMTLLTFKESRLNQDLVDKCFSRGTLDSILSNLKLQFEAIETSMYPVAQAPRQSHRTMSDYPVHV